MNPDAANLLPHRSPPRSNSPFHRSIDRVSAIHESGHAVVGHLSKLHVERVFLLGDGNGGTVVDVEPNEARMLHFYYAGYCAELEFGGDPRAAALGAGSDALLASALFPGHRPAVEIARARSLVRYHKDVIHQTALELMAKRRLEHGDLVRLMDASR